VNGNLKPPPIALLPGSLLLEDVQGELFLKESRSSGDPTIVGKRVRSRIESLLRRFEHEFDVVIHDCAPGLSFAALSALKIANKVLVPFRPDYVSQFAVDRVAMLIQDCHSIEAVGEIPFEKRRYVTIANCVRRQNGAGSLEKVGADRVMIEEMAAIHPIMRCELPQSDAIASAFDWQASRRTIEAKYGPETAVIRAFYEEFTALAGL
jgi:cellulose biosynthesis protein BcsQ